MNLHENTLFDLNLWVKVTQDFAKYPLYHVTYSGTKFESSTSDCLGGDAGTKFEVATSDCLGGDAFTKKIDYLTVDLDVWVKVTRNF